VPVPGVPVPGVPVPELAPGPASAEGVPSPTGSG